MLLKLFSVLVAITLTLSILGVLICFKVHNIEFFRKGDKKHVDVVWFDVTLFMEKCFAEKLHVLISFQISILSH